MSARGLTDERAAREIAVIFTGLLLATLAGALIARYSAVWATVFLALLFLQFVVVTAFAWLRAITSFKTYCFAYALGYTQGAIRGLLQKPTAKNLSPQIDWWADADDALKNLRVIQG
jgi:endonuclease/exonuclease/phosphatase (EEP) superfamily protein YafD